MPRLRLPPPRLPVLLVVVVTVSLGLHHYVFHSPAPQRMRRNAAVPEMFSPAQRKAADGASSSAKLRSASDDTAPRVKPLLSSNIIPNNTVIERSDHEGSVLTNSATTRRKHFTTSQPPPCALSSMAEICEEDNEYDEEIALAIRAALKNSHVGLLLQDPIVNGLLHDSTFTKEEARPSSRFAARLGPGVNYLEACPSQQVTRPLKRGHNKHGTWFHVVSQDNVFQSIVYEACSSSNATCRLGSDASTTDKTTCRQLFIYRKKLVLYDDGLKVTEEDILIPSCCACYVSHARVMDTGH